MKKIVEKVYNRLLLVLPDELYLKVKFRQLMGKKLNLKNPQTFSEKLQWLKLYDRRPEYTTMVDKYAVKGYVAKIIGDEYIIPTLGVWDRPEDIDWDSLPNQFVLKCTHDSGGLVICRDKSKLDKKAATTKLRKTLKQNYYRKWREWPYKNVPRRIIAEQYIEPAPDLKDLPDYKFFCFDGEVKALFVATDRQKEGEEVKFDFFDADFNRLPFKQGHEHAAVTPRKPKNFEVMKKAAAQLSKGLPHARVDLYEVGDKVLFGEITLFHFSGLVPFRPEEWDKVFGDMLTLPGERLGGAIIRLMDNDEIEFSYPDLPDYKFFCFNGKVKGLYVATDRQKEGEELKLDFYDENFNHLPIKQSHENANTALKKPLQFEEMKVLAERLSQGIPHVRVDFYELESGILFGEMTFFSFSGLLPYQPEEWDKIFGNMLTLPGERGGGI